MREFLSSILLKKGLRSDALWTHPFFYKSFLKIIPLFLDTFALMRSQFWQRKDIERIQQKRLQTLFREAVKVPYWHDLLEKAGIVASMSVAEQLSRIPITSKKDLSQKDLSYIADTKLLSRSNPDRTSGSTGRPFHFYQDWQASLRSCAVTERTFRTATRGKRYPIVYMRSRDRNGFTFYKHLWFFVRGYRSIPYRMDDFKKLERITQGFVLYGYTSTVVEVARQMEMLGMTLPVKAAVVAGEYLSSQQREYIARVFKTEVFTLYASRETGFLAFECEHHALHINEEWALLEIVDREGHSLPSNREGRIIVTTFDNRVMPFIRYDIGDIGSISDKQCACGRTLCTLSFKGRSAELIEGEDGHVVSLLEVSATFDYFWDTVQQFQIIQTGPTSFVLKIVPGPLFSERKDALKAELLRILSPHTKLLWQTVETIPEAESGKAVYFIRDFNHRV